MQQPGTCLIIPCYNENRTVILLLEHVQRVLSQINESFSVVVVDDCSTDDTPELLAAFRFSAPNISFHPIRLRFNVGHQGAIYQGFLYAQHIPATHFIVMDSDGEDNPDALPELLQYKEEDIVHVVRGKRKEGLMFRFSYSVYKLIFRTITGKQMNFGNYCMIRRGILESAIYHTFSHLAGFLSKQRCKRKYIVVSREKRIDGESKMNFKGLLSHAFKSFVEYGEDMLLVFLKLFILIMILFVAAMSNVLYQKFYANTAIPGWASTIGLGLMNMAIITMGFFIIGILLLHLNRRRGDNQAHYDEIKVAQK
jgi:glycosyltransferase involved in cell wall biosynthesis